LRRLLRRRIENPLATELLEERFLAARAVRISLNPAGDGLEFQALPTAA
jgi:ATP-dependent Clp protease ATP-binding subunit ClpA